MRSCHRAMTKLEVYVLYERHRDRGLLLETQEVNGRISELLQQVLVHDHWDKWEQDAVSGSCSEQSAGEDANEQDADWRMECALDSEEG